MNLNKFYKRHHTSSLLQDDDETICDDDEVNLLQGIRETANLTGDERRRAIRNRQQIDRTSAEQGVELRSIQGEQFTYYEIQPGDSLQGICLRFSLEVNQVRRMNNLMTDQDFYGLKLLKLPLGRFKLLQSQIKTSPGSAHRDQAMSPQPTSQQQQQPRPPPAHPHHFKPLLIPDHSSYEFSSNHSDHNGDRHLGPGEADSGTVDRIFESLDNHVEKIKLATMDYDKRADEILEGIDVDDSHSTLGAYRASREASKIPELFFSGENFGLNIKRLVALIVFVCVVVPLIYINQAHVI